MKKLTEEMVIARTKISDMSKIKRLNCWGSELADVSLLRRMPNVEVLSLSINKINNLSDFEHCRQLQELYVRQNEIRDLNQVCYLQALTNLRHLWLGENPCASVEGYRSAVIRALPQLQKLDNVAIQPDELSEAMKKGRMLYHPEEEQPEPEDDYEQAPPAHLGQSGYRTHQDYTEQQYYRHSSPERSPPRHEHLTVRAMSPTNRNRLIIMQPQPEYEQEESVEYYEEDDRREYDSPPRQSPRKKEGRRSYSPENDTGPVYYEDRRNANNYEQDSPKHQQYYDRSPMKEYFEDTRITPDSPKDSKFPNSHSANSVKEYANGDRHYHQSSQYRHHDSSDGSNHSHSGGYETPRRERCDKNSCTVNHKPPFNRRPATRNSNILSAVLCLVKELDYPSLEVVEMTIRCRMAELED